MWQNRGSKQPRSTQRSGQLQGKLGSEARAVKASLPASRHCLLGKAGYVLYPWNEPLAKLLSMRGLGRKMQAGQAVCAESLQVAPTPFFRGSEAAPRARGGRGDRGGRGGRTRGRGYSLGSQQKLGQLGAPVLPAPWTKVASWSLTGLLPGDEVEVLQKIGDDEKAPAHSGTRSVTGLPHETAI